VDRAVQNSAIPLANEKLQKTDERPTFVRTSSHWKSEGEEVSTPHCRIFITLHHTFIASSYHGAAHSWIHPPIHGWIHPVILASLHAFIASTMPRSMHSSRY